MAKACHMCDGSGRTPHLDSVGLFYRECPECHGGRLTAKFAELEARVKALEEAAERRENYERERGE